MISHAGVLGSYSSSKLLTYSQPFTYELARLNIRRFPLFLRLGSSPLLRLFQQENRLRPDRRLASRTGWIILLSTLCSLCEFADSVSFEANVWILFFHSIAALW